MIHKGIGSKNRPVFRGHGVIIQGAPFDFFLIVFCVFFGKTGEIHALAVFKHFRRKIRTDQNAFADSDFFHAVEGFQFRHQFIAQGIILLNAVKIGFRIFLIVPVAVDVQTEIPFRHFPSGNIFRSRTVQHSGKAQKQNAAQTHRDHRHHRAFFIAAQICRRQTPQRYRTMLLTSFGFQRRFAFLITDRLNGRNFRSHLHGTQQGNNHRQ